MGADDDEMRAVLARARTVAVVGLSDRPERDSHQIARYLLAQGYEVIPVNPNVSEVLGRRSYPSLREVPPEIPVDLVDIFRRSEEVGPIVDAAIARGVRAVWMQLGVVHEAAAAAARAQGLFVVQDRCVMVEHRRLRVGPVEDRTARNGSKDS